ncbi:hypothetical protein QBC41DRAFT_230447 [Cercophora samala]|uniref:Uncharacterized protein n=1 Tax=Cercophora samala TaxID=330535 RepID=A0AA39ZA24_9PEZI|nr:hypothetical protein QBC41DRAFT_230447 [Cercophora samala]
MCQYFTQVYPCGYQTPIMMLRTCDSDWKPTGTPRKPPCPLVEKSNLQKIEIKDRKDWWYKGEFCEGCDRDECKIRRACVKRPTSFDKALEKYRKAKKIISEGYVEEEE